MQKSAYDLFGRKSISEVLEEKKNKELKEWIDKCKNIYPATLKHETKNNNSN